jgi:hypothetical protein
MMMWVWTASSCLQPFARRQDLASRLERAGCNSAGYETQEIEDQRE